MPATAGHNLPPTPSDIFDPRIADLNAELVHLTEGEITAPIAAALRDIQKRARDLETELTAAKASDKAPHLDAAARIEAAYRPLTASAVEIKAEARKHVDLFLLAEEKRRKDEAAEAKRIADEAKRIADEAVQDDDPFGNADDAVHDARLATIAADHAERKADAGASIGSASGITKAASLRSYWSVKVIDPAAMVNHFAGDPGVIEAATKAANALVRATKGSMKIPGCETIEDRRSV
jgi:hypothetical protein